LSGKKRIAVASIIQETNTFSLQPSTYADFESQGVWFSDAININGAGLNLEITGAISRLQEMGYEAIPIMRAWAMSGGILQESSFSRLRNELKEGIKSAGPLDGVVLNLHGALVSDEEFHCDARFVEDVREIIGPDIPLMVTHDLHANVGTRIVAAATSVIGYKTYPHVDQRDTGARAVELLDIAFNQNAKVKTVLKKVNMLIPAEIQPIANYPMNIIRELANTYLDDEIVDISLFPVQPWLDIPELGFGFLITNVGSQARAEEIGRILAKKLWEIKDEFLLSLVSLAGAIETVNSSPHTKPFVLVHSADAPPGGATGDDAAVLAGLLTTSPSIKSAMTVVDVDGVEICTKAGVGAHVDLTIGSSLDPRWSPPVRFTGKVTRVSSDPITLTGPVMNGQLVSMGRWATVDSGVGVHVLITERPAPTFDPSAYTQAGLNISELDAVQVRSCALFRSGFTGLYEDAFILDLPGATTPNLTSLEFHNIPRPMFPLDADVSTLENLYS
jgi:microcystin degradation protein MlrC